ncbi:O-antigen ligase family protein [Sphingomonas silueang]|uniref:O-antigen ligase family protein n=1 Tax=Sphingomonas silueang TaxID=3156617 RepID=UPI0032B50719
MPVAPVTARRPALPALRTGADGFNRFVATLGYVGLLLLATVGTSPFAEYTQAADDSQGDVLRQVLTGALFLLTLIGLRRSGRLAARWALPVGISVLLGYCLFTISWSMVPGVAIRRLALTTIVIWMLFATSRELGYARTLYVTRIVLVLLLVCNFLTMLVPGLGTHPFVLGEDTSIVGDWRGMLPHKNMTGAVCAFTVLLFLFDRRRVPVAASLVVIPAALIFLYFTHSRTSQGILLLAVIGGWLVRRYDANYRGLALTLAILVGVVLIQLVILYSGVLENALSDPTALTGRAQIWPYLIDYAGRYPWTGSGFGSFWQIGPDAPIWDYTDGWIAEHAGHGHNGYLDLVVTIGLPGTLLAIAVLILWPITRLLTSFSIGRAQRSLLLAMLLFSAGHNMTETSLLDRMAIPNLFLFLAIALIYHLSNAGEGAHRQLRERALRLLRRVRRRPARPLPRRAR